MKKFNYCIEKFVETHNGTIQILLLAVVIFFNCLIVIVYKDVATHIPGVTHLFFKFEVSESFCSFCISS